MDKKFVIVALLVVLVIGIGGWILWEGGSKDTGTVESNSIQPEPQALSTDSDSNSQTQLAEFTAANVAEHATKDDCWTIISGKVYDLTSYIPRHQGGDEIVRACGTDGTSLFTQRETSDGQEVGSGTPHSRTATSQLERLYIGDLSTATSDNSDTNDRTAD